MCTIDATPDSTLPEGALYNAAEVLRIGLIHNNANHDGNVLRPKDDDPQPWVDDGYDSDSDVMSLEDIMNALRQEMSDLVASIRVVRKQEVELVVLSSRGTFPNKMGNKKVYPEPWANENVKFAKQLDVEHTRIVDSNLDNQPHTSEPTSPLLHDLPSRDCVAQPMSSES